MGLDDGPKNCRYTPENVAAQNTITAKFVRNFIVHAAAALGAETCQSVVCGAEWFSSYEAHLSVVVKASKGFGFSVYRVSNCSRVLSSDHRLRRVQK